MNIIGWRCATCDAELPIGTVFPWRCPNSSSADRHHVLRAVGATSPIADVVDDLNPFVAFDAGLAWAAFADAHGMDRAARAALVRDLDAQVERVAGTGFRVTPFARSAELSDALAFDRGGGVWVKDDTGNVAGSQKARHLFTILLHLRAAELLGLAPWASAAQRPRLAISSCGNAAIAASTLAAAVGWPIDVFVPPWAGQAVVVRLHALGAHVQVCPRRPADPPGDPCIHRFREAVAAGAVPFGVQGSENALCLDGGRTLGWEILAAAAAQGVHLDRVFVQVGGGAFAACMGAALQSVFPPPALVAVQAAGCAPLAGAWGRARALPGGPLTAAQHWAECMHVWGSEGEPEPTSVADGILDDETYDWISIVDGLVATGGDVVVAPEAAMVEAHAVLAASTGIDATATGTAGLAGVIALRTEIGDGERIAIVASGITRH
ncbi:MAG: PLP-dependent lyase/thiolase [Ilumatobacteraceae bacterium]